MQNQILKFLEENKKPHNTTEIAVHVNGDKVQVLQILMKLAENDCIEHSSVACCEYWTYKNKNKGLLQKILGYLEN